jgi:glycosyltransferase involved in cell wall biosynthesis
MRLTWMSNSPWTPSGYGCQTRHITNRLIKAGYPTAVIATYGHTGSPLKVGDLMVYGSGWSPYCADVVDAHSVNFKADVMISFMDIWVYNTSDIRTRWVQWIPVDHDPIPVPVGIVAHRAYHRISCSKFGKDKINEAGMDCDYIPCVVETDVFKPSDMTEDERKITGLTKDKFIVGMVAANKGDPPRKAFWANIEAFAELHKKHPDTLLYMHTMDGHPSRGEQVDIPAFCESKGLVMGKDVILPDQYQYFLGFPDPWMAKLYSTMDVHLLVSMGEGFGIPILEAQACGTPVIVGDWTSMGELCFSGWKVDKKDSLPIWGALQSNTFLPRVGAIVDKLEAAYQIQGNVSYRREARKGALAYDADKVITKYWLPTLKKIEDKIADEITTTYMLNGGKL